MLVIDGVFAPTAAGGPVFHLAIAIERPAIATVRAKLRCGLLASFVRRGLLADADARAPIARVVNGMMRAGQTPMLYVESANKRAIDLYVASGFVPRTELSLLYAKRVG